MDELQPSSEPWHWLYSIPWWGYACLSFSVVFLILGLDALLGRGNAVLSSLGGLSMLVSLFASILGFISLLCRWAGKGSQYKRKSIRFHRRALAFGFLFCMGTIFWVEIVPGARLAVNEAALRSEAEQAAGAPWTEHIFSEGNFIVATPSNWVRVDVPELGSSGYSIVDEYHQMNVIVAATPKVDSSLKSLDELHQMAIGNVAPNGSNHTAGKTQSFMHGSFSARQTKVAWEYSTRKALTATRQIEFPEYWVEIDLIASPSMFDKYEERLNRIADSIRRE